MLSLVIIAIVCTIIYNLSIILIYKRIPISLSETSYMLAGENKSGLRYLFSLYCCVLCFCIMPCLLEILPEYFQFVPFIMCAGLLFAGMSPMFKEGLEKTVHYLSSMLAFIMYLIFMCVMMEWYMIVGYILLLGGLIVWKKECYTYFAEILAFIFMSIFILI